MPSASSPTSVSSFDVATRGQVFTPPEVVARMLALRRNAGRVLEPSAGDGAFSRHLPGCVAIEVDPRHAPPGALIADFFAYPESEKFDTIVGNPPYVRFQDIRPETRALLAADHFDGRSNLYLFFIEKCLRHLNPGGELIFITPRDFLKATSARHLNRLFWEQGTITHFYDLGDARIFADATPNCAIWRFVRGDSSRRTETGDGVRRFVFAGGHLQFVAGDYPVRLADVFFVKVGAVSGADDVFASERHGNVDFVCSTTVRDGRTRAMVWVDAPTPYLRRHKAKLLARRIRPFDATNWWQWGRSDYVSDRPRLYVNGKTRHPKPFFRHECQRYDGSVLALFPHDPDVDLDALCTLLNGVDWADLGFVCDGRRLFTQRSLEQAMLPAEFAPYATARSASALR